MASDDAVYKKLRLYNAVMGFFHLAQGSLILWLSNDFKLPITTDYLSIDLATKAIHPIKSVVYDLRIGPIIAIFLLISALAHFLLATVLYKWYIANLAKKINYARWYEYALSSSVMIAVIAMLCGMYDLSGLILIFALNACMNLFGLSMELHNQTTTQTNWTTYIFGCFVGIVPWVIIYLYFSGAVASVGDVIPKFVYFILATIFFTFMCFAVNMYLQYRKVGKWKDYLYGEVVYVALSLIAKSALAWQIFFGTLRPQ
jgi:hypothetical protein